MRSNIIFPTLKDPKAYDVVEPKLCEEPGCGKTFMRLVNTNSRMCGHCQAKMVLNDRKSRALNELVKQEMASKRIQ